jgi:SAM-dependent methyltransferase
MQQIDIFSGGVSPGSSLVSERHLAAACLALLDDETRLTPTETGLAAGAPASPPSLVGHLRASMLRGDDPLGEAFQSLRSPARRRGAGAVYTPANVVSSMVDWLAQECRPVRIVDPGAGSGRFLFAAAQRFPRAHLVASEYDPLAALMLRARAAVLGLSSRVEVVLGDYRDLELERSDGVTAFIGNPPYVRHHDIAPEWKAWYTEQCLRYGIRASALAGLHLHFFVQTLRLASPGDVGSFVTAAEWLDVNYGSALRSLLAQPLGGIDLKVLAPEIEAFPGTATTAVITGFRVGERTAPMHVRRLADLEELAAADRGLPVSRTRLSSMARWSTLIRTETRRPHGSIELGELFRVHRGQVTGANEVWVTEHNSHGLPDRLLVPSVTKAKDLIKAGEHLQSTQALRKVVELPPDLGMLPDEDDESVQRFLRWARERGADRGYVARHRKAWWSVGLRAPAPILCTYMGRRAPQFTRNVCGARHINVAHGLYPRAPIDEPLLDRIAQWLNRNVDVSQGRTYAGGLTKFEPGELERLLLPDLAELAV